MIFLQDYKPDELKLYVAPPQYKCRTPYSSGSRTCNESFQRARFLEAHQRDVHGHEHEDDIKCPECKQKLPTQGVLNEHMRLVHPHDFRIGERITMIGNYIECPRCKQELLPKASSTSICDLSTHMISELEEGLYYIECPRCKQELLLKASSTSICDLSTHMISELEEGLYYIEYPRCKQKSPTQDVLNEHMRLVDPHDFRIGGRIAMIRNSGETQPSSLPTNKPEPSLVYGTTSRARMAGTTSTVARRRNRLP